MLWTTSDELTNSSDDSFAARDAGTVVATGHGLVAEVVQRALNFSWRIADRYDVPSHNLSDSSNSEELFAC